MSRNTDAAAVAALPPRTVLVVVTRRIGDVLLATPLIRSLRAAWPAAAIDALVFQGTEGALAGNADLRRVWTVPQRPRLMPHLSLVSSLARRYDLALSLVPGDRPTLYAFIAGRKRMGLLLERPQDAWKRRLLHAWVPFDDLNTHTVRMHLALARALGIAAKSAVSIAWASQDEQAVDALLAGNTQPLAVLHAHPRYRYKMWPQDHWIALAHALARHGYRIALTGSGEPDERAYLDALMQEFPAGSVNAAGRLTLGGSACLVARAQRYVGVDTAMTHIAAALGVPTVALFGPSNPVKWGPWPRDHTPGTNPWRRCGTQYAGNVVLLQGVGVCVPCLLEGCDRHVGSASDCLEQLPVARVLRALDRFETA